MRAPENVFLRFVNSSIASSQKTSLYSSIIADILSVMTILRQAFFIRLPLQLMLLAFLFILTGCENGGILSNDKDNLSPIPEVTSNNISSIIRPDHRFTVTFSLQMDQKSVEEALYLNNQSEELSFIWSSDGKTVTAWPASSLQYDTKYSFNIEKSAFSIDGQAMSDSFSESFRTMKNNTQILPVDGRYYRASDKPTNTNVVMENGDVKTVMEVDSETGEFSGLLINLNDVAARVGDQFSITAFRNSVSLKISPATVEIGLADIFNGVFSLNLVEE